MLKKTTISSESSNSFIILRDALYSEVYPVLVKGRPLVVLCVGTDRSTGDSLGPLVGHKLKLLVRDRIALYGTLKFPVHAKNIAENISDIYEKHVNPFIIAVDACLGSAKNVGKIIVDSKPLKPGSAMDKNLPSIGDISITGVVNISSSMDFMMLQNTRLYTVMSLADSISLGIYHCMLKTLGRKLTI